MKIELSIKSNHLPDWRTFEGVRELLQNAADAADEFDAPLTVRYRADAQTLVIENKGTTLPYEALLYGHTTKADNDELRGKFGEGLKDGTLALLRAGHTVKIRSGSEVWTPRIEHSEKFKADVLTFRIDKGRKPVERVQVEIGNIDKEWWEEKKACFLFLKKKEDRLRINTSYGALLLDNEYARKIFVKGIFVEHDPEIRFGYDLDKDVQVDRDRKMVMRHDLHWRTRMIWQHSTAEREELIAPFMEALQGEHRDLSGLDSWGASQLDDKLKEQVVAKFKADHGEDAIAVETVLDGQEVETLGKKSVLVTNKPLKAILDDEMGDLYDIKKALQNEAVNFYSWADLEPEEKANLDSAVFLIDRVDRLSPDDIRIVDFRSEAKCGMYKSDKDQVFVARRILADRDKALEVLVEEVSHRSYDHASNMAKIWSKIVAHLRSARVRTWRTRKARSFPAARSASETASGETEAKLN